METQTTFEPGSANSLVVTIISAVAETEDKPTEEITDPPLYEVIDTEALSDSFADSSATTTEESLSIEFTYRGHRVVVRNDTWVQVYTPAEE